MLIAGGLGQSFGIISLYATDGLPEANRILIDVWVAEGHLVAGGLYVAAHRAWRSGAPWRALSAFGSLATISLMLPMLPVVFSRASWPFRIPQIVYLASSVVLLWCALRPGRALVVDTAPAPH